MLSYLKKPLNIAAILAPIVVVAALYFGVDKKLAKSIDLHPSMVFLIQGAWLGFFVFSTLNLKLFLQHLRKSQAKISQFALVLFLAIFAAGITSSKVPPLHRVQSDEALPMSMAQNMYAQGVGGSCDMGYFSKSNDLNCVAQANNFKAKLQGAVYSWALVWTKNPTQYGFMIHMILYTLSIFLFWSAIWLWTRKSLQAIVGASFLAFTPLIMIQFRSLSVEPWHVFFSLLALNILHFARSQTSSQGEIKLNFKSPQSILKTPLIPWLWLAFSLVLLAQTRQESGILMVAFILPSLGLLLRQPKIFLSLTTTIAIFITPVIITILSYKGFDFQGGEHKAHGWDNFVTHSRILWEQMTLLEKDERLLNPFLIAHTYLALFGFSLFTLRILWKKSAPFIWKQFFKKELPQNFKPLESWILPAVLFLVLFHLQSYIILENVSGDMTIKINQRYMLVILPTLVFFIAWLFQEVFIQVPTKLFGPARKPQFTQWSLALLIGTFAFSLAYQHRNSFEENIMYKDLHLPTEQREIYAWMDKNPGRSLFIYNRPWHFIGIGQSALGPTAWNRKSKQDKAKLFREYKGRIYYIRGLDCWDRKTYHSKVKVTRKPQLCDDVERINKLQLLQKTKILNGYELMIHKILIGSGSSNNSATPASHAVQPEHFLLKHQLGQGLHFRVPKTPRKYELRLNHLNGPILQTFTPEESIKGFLVAKPVSPSESLKSGIHNIVLVDVTRSKPLQVFTGFTQLKTPQSLSLTKQPIERQMQGWGSLKINRSVLDKPLTIAQQYFPEGFGTHAPSAIKFRIPTNYTRFVSLIGMDDDESCGDGSKFEVWGDGKIIGKSPLIRSGNIQRFSVPIKGISILEIKTSIGKTNFCDHTDWIWPTLEQ